MGGGGGGGGGGDSLMSIKMKIMVMNDCSSLLLTKYILYNNMISLFCYR